MLMFAARREHVARLIEPALSAGRWVVCDRFSDTTFAYQVGGRGLDAAKFDVLESWVHPGLQPDLTLLFDLPPEVAASRVRSTGVNPDRFEREQRDFFVRVRDAYLERAHRAPQRIRIIDADRSPEQIRAQIEAIVAERWFA
ncbi:Thymidylate kinase [bioreactor metagenome]|uniref:dTMP kinase n=1 Tax=bioreactor metagenome TaxID=1076179 RepID=A0A645J229_9ZZZZ